ncbi:conserved hypothetical protein [Vibrio nigripulchritudo SOn1]|uniref:DUF1800 domain-containing protein n=1 Tax=Vibrio nigripulchritudo SOn1 TaxID=1238450 RepID=A0AAV2VS83_9VIBR|nr:DUF1800 domain-containing protein [Vibrio nigripulchritudo]CCO47595.1 conserved hypothetical protein [Vibrio nigripulchritudo SOn1]
MRTIRNLPLLLVVLASAFIHSAQASDDDKTYFQVLLSATFGPTQSDFNELKKLGRSEWIDLQISQTPTYHYPRFSNSTAFEKQARREYVWWQVVTESPDQLRQRSAFALSQIFVVSRFGGLGRYPDSLASYYDVLVKHAFGNFRDLLQEVTLHPAMGKYLSMMGSKKANPEKGRFPDENYAREVMQLFTLGLYQLNPDGSVKRNAGEPIPAYSQNDVEELARILTGWTRSEKSLVKPMKNNGNHHDYETKRFMGYAFKAWQTPKQDLEQALDILFHHPNLPPHISRLLIQRLTSSNPSPQYIERVANVFVNNGMGIRGDLSAVFKAILMDPEAYSEQSIKVKEPLLAMTQLYRAFPPQNKQEVDVRRVYRVTQQGPLRSPSVFNFYSPDYQPTGDLAQHNLVAPELALMNWNSYTEMVNIMLSYLVQSNKNAPTANMQGWLNLTSQPKSLVSALDFVLLGGTMSKEMKNILVIHSAKYGNVKGTRKQKRLLQELLYLTLTSDEYFVQGGLK